MAGRFEEPGPTVGASKLLEVRVDMERNTKPKREPTPKPADPIADAVDEASQESFPASDPPSWTVGTGEKGSDAPPDPARADPKTAGCATSFLMQKRGEIGEVCGDQQPDPTEEYVQPEKEKEAGGAT